MKIEYRRLDPAETDRASEQITASYAAAYHGLMDAAYLDSLTARHWSPILQNSLERGDTCLVALDGGRIIGSAVFGLSEPEGPLCAELHAIYLLPDYVGRGIGHAFYQALEEEMVRQGCSSCTLEVLSSNERAIRFYRSHGFCNARSFVVEENGMTLSCDQMTKTL